MPNLSTSAPDEHAPSVTLTSSLNYIPLAIKHPYIIPPFATPHPPTAPKTHNKH